MGRCGANTVVLDDFQRERLLGCLLSEAAANLIGPSVGSFFFRRSQSMPTAKTERPARCGGRLTDVSSRPLRQIRPQIGLFSKKGSVKKRPPLGWHGFEILERHMHSAATWDGSITAVWGAMGSAGGIAAAACTRHGTINMWYRHVFGHDTAWLQPTNTPAWIKYSLPLA